MGSYLIPLCSTPMILVSLNICIRCRGTYPCHHLKHKICQNSLLFRDQRGICESVMELPENWAKFWPCTSVGNSSSEFYNTVTPGWCFISIFIISPLFWLDICPTFHVLLFRLVFYLRKSVVTELHFLMWNCPLAKSILILLMSLHVFNFQFSLVWTNWDCVASWFVAIWPTLVCYLYIEKPIISYL